MPPPPSLIIIIIIILFVIPGTAQGERARVESLGGTVAWYGLRRPEDGEPIEGTGVHRVNGNLALSRAVGDFHEKPCVSAAPDLRTVALDEASDEFIIIASGAPPL